MPPKKKADNSAMQELKRDLKAGTPKRAYLFYGEEAFLRDYYLDRLKEAVLPAGLEDFNLHTARGKECSIDWIEQAVDCLPMMSQRTLVAVTDFDLFSQGDKGRDRLMALLSALPDYCTLVFVYDLISPRLDGRSKLLALLKKLGGVVNFQRQDEEQLTGWICRQFKKAGKSIDTRDAGYLVFLCGDLMHDLASEIGKIAAYCPHDRVTREDIDALAVPKVDAVMFKMTDALAAKDFDKAASVLADLLHNRESPVMILSVMGKYFRQLYTARLCLDGGKGKAEFMDMWRMGGGYFMDQQAQRLLDAARRFSPAWCRYAVRRCAETDAAVKSAPRGQDGEVLTALLAELASGRRVAV